MRFKFAFIFLKHKHLVYAHFNFVSFCLFFNNCSQKLSFSFILLSLTGCKVFLMKRREAMQVKHKFDKAYLRQKGMQESLFQRLHNSSSCIELSIQYRMNREIMRLCNELTYDGCLQCGSEEVSNSILHLSKESERIDKKFPSWLASAFDTDIAKSVYFLNTDNYEVHSVKSKSDTEADLVILILQFLFQHKVVQSSVGVIAPYRKQADLIKAKLRNLNIDEIEVNTVDQYQGRDKDVIIISCIKPSDSLPKTEQAGGILNDEKRLNVAISRARKKLIIIGSKITLSGYKPFKSLINCLRENQFLDIT